MVECTALERQQRVKLFEGSNPSLSAQLVYLDSMKSFKEKVIDIVKKIPQGVVLTYKQVAKQAGNEKASRAVGTVMAHNTDKNLPCHRVVKSDGSIGMYNGLRGKSKEAILKKEGVKFGEDGKAILN